MDSQSRNNLFKVAVALLVVFILFFSFGKISLPGLDFIKKVQLADIFTSKKQRKHITVISDSTKLNELDTVPLLKDSIKIPTTNSTNFKRVFIDSNSGKPTFKYNAAPICDTCKGERVLFVGDSELDGLFKPAHEYCLANGHKLVTSVIWYGSHTRHWAITDTLDYYINKVNKSFNLICFWMSLFYVINVSN